GLAGGPERHQGGAAVLEQLPAETHEAGRVRIQLGIERSEDRCQDSLHGPSSLERISSPCSRRGYLRADAPCAGPLRPQHWVTQRWNKERGRSRAPCRWLTQALSVLVCLIMNSFRNEFDRDDHLGSRPADTRACPGGDAL